MDEVLDELKADNLYFEDEETRDKAQKKKNKKDKKKKKSV